MRSWRVGVGKQSWKVGVGKQSRLNKVVRVDCHLHVHINHNNPRYLIIIISGIIRAFNFNFFFASCVKSPASPAHNNDLSWPCHRKMCIIVLSCVALWYVIPQFLQLIHPQHKKYILYIFFVKFCCKLKPRKSTKKQQLVHCMIYM